MRLNPGSVLIRGIDTLIYIAPNPEKYMVVPNRTKPLLDEESLEKIVCFRCFKSMIVSSSLKCLINTTIWTSLFFFRKSLQKLMI